MSSECDDNEDLRPKQQKRRINIHSYISQGSETHLQINTNVVQCLLDEYIDNMEMLC